MDRKNRVTLSNDKCVSMIVLKVARDSSETREEGRGSEEGGREGAEGGRVEGAQLWHLLQISLEPCELDAVGSEATSGDEAAVAV
jgi:hypothetical protein